MQSCVAYFKCSVCYLTNYLFEYYRDLQIGPTVYNHPLADRIIGPHKWLNNAVRTILSIEFD